MKQANEEKLLRIIPPPAGTRGFVMTQGTRVETANGEEVHGVTKIVLTCEVDDIWRAEISCFVQPPDVTCLADMSRRFAPTRWQRMVMAARRLLRLTAAA